MANCEICKGWVWNTGRHVCPPRWACYQSQDEEAPDAEIIFAFDAAHAAEKYADHYDCQAAEYPDEQTVCVRKCDDTSAEWEEFSITGDWSRDYSASKIERDDEADGEKGQGDGRS